MSSGRLSPEAALELAAAVLAAYGASAVDARAVAEHLVDAEVAGLPSHGLLRVPQYVDEILAGEIDPVAVPALSRPSTGRLDIDAHRCFGQVAGDLAVHYGVELAKKQGMGLVTVRQCGHAGRIGAYAERFGAAGLMSLIFCSGPRSGHRVAPFGGRDGRLATNPVAFGIPTSGQPIIGDFSTAAAPEGRIRKLRNLGLEAAPGTLLDAEGVPTTDPNVLYGRPAGTILPLGGELLGHRGFALGLLVESMATLLTGDETADDSRAGNNLAFMAIEVDPTFRLRADRMAEYVRSSRPRVGRSVKLPGSIEQDHRAATREIVLDATAWAAIVERAGRAGILIE